MIERVASPRRKARRRRPHRRRTPGARPARPGHGSVCRRPARPPGASAGGSPASAPAGPRPRTRRAAAAAGPPARAPRRRRAPLPRPGGAGRPGRRSATRHPAAEARAGAGRRRRPAPPTPRRPAHRASPPPAGPRVVARRTPAASAGRVAPRGEDHDSRARRPSAPRQRALALALLLVAVAAVLAVVLLPVVLLHRHYDDALESLSQRLDRYRRVAAQAPEYRKALDTMKERDARRFYLRNTAPNLAAAELQEQVRAAIEGNGGRISTSQNQAPRDDGRFKQIVVSVQFFATTPNLQKILTAIETQQPYLIVDNLTLRPLNAFRGFRPAAGTGAGDQRAARRVGVRVCRAGEATRRGCAGPRRRRPAAKGRDAMSAISRACAAGCCGWCRWPRCVSRLGDRLGPRARPGPGARADRPAGAGARTSRSTAARRRRPENGRAHAVQPDPPSGAAGRRRGAEADHEARPVHAHRHARRRRQEHRLPARGRRRQGPARAAGRVDQRARRRRGEARPRAAHDGRRVRGPDPQGADESQADGSPSPAAGSAPARARAPAAGPACRRDRWRRRGAGASGAVATPQPAAATGSACRASRGARGRCRCGARRHRRRGRDAVRPWAEVDQRYTQPRRDAGAGDRDNDGRAADAASDRTPSNAGQRWKSNNESNAAVRDSPLCRALPSSRRCSPRRAPAIRRVPTRTDPVPGDAGQFAARRRPGAAPRLPPTRRPDKREALQGHRRAGEGAAARRRPAPGARRADDRRRRGAQLRGRRSARGDPQHPGRHPQRELHDRPDGRRHGDDPHVVGNLARRAARDAGDAAADERRRDGEGGRHVQDRPAGGRGARQRLAAARQFGSARCRPASRCRSCRCATSACARCCASSSPSPRTRRRSARTSCATC